MFSLNNLKDQMSMTASSMFSAYASVTTFMMLFRSIANELIPALFRSYIYKALNYLFAPLFSCDLTLVVDGFSDMTRNQVFDAAELYLWEKIGPHTERLHINKAPRKKNIGVDIDKDEEVLDTFDGVAKLKWQFITETKKGKNDRTSKGWYF